MTKRLKFYETQGEFQAFACGRVVLRNKGQSEMLLKLHKKRCVLCASVKDKPMVIEVHPSSAQEAMNPTSAHPKFILCEHYIRQFECSQCSQNIK